jgi:hypothetical protein
MDMAHIVFTGICTFAAANADHNGRPMAAIFAADTINMAPEHKHQVYLLVDDTYTLTIDADTNSANRTQGTATSEMGRDYQYVVLDEEAVRIKDMNSPPLRVAPSAANYDEVPNGNDADSMHWVPGLDRVWARMFGRHQARPPVVGQTPHSTPALVGARMELTEGYLAPSYVSHDVWKFAPRWFHFKYQQAIAQEVALDVQLSTSTGTLVLATYGLDCPTLGTPIAQFRITQKVPNPGNPIVVLLANVPPGELLPGGYVSCAGNPSECLMGNDDPCPATCVDHHFEIYYKSLYKKPPRSPAVPKRVKAGPSSQVFALRVAGDNCGPNNYP